MAMAKPWNLGNDIVDLSDPRHEGKAGDRRFMERVFSEAEQRDIRAGPDPDTAVWVRWAGKEAAFKTVSKARGAAPTFVHADFQVTILEPSGPSANGGKDGAPPMTRFGQVNYRDLFLPLRVEIVGSALHAVCWSPDSGGEVPPLSWGSAEVPERVSDWKDAYRPRFSKAEWACITHQASALARLEARRSMAAELNVPEPELEIRCGPGTPGRRIPTVYRSGHEFPADLTLSHHGRLLAWAFLRRKN
jgi:phosphopantetheine--protein transferase-like protein